MPGDKRTGTPPGQGGEDEDEEEDEDEDEDEDEEQDNGIYIRVSQKNTLV